MCNTLDRLGDKVVYHETASGIAYRDFTFDLGPRSEYRLVATLYIDNGEAQIRAERLGAPEGEYFWYVSYEPVDFGSLVHTHEVALASLNKLLTHQTRIRHRIGLVFSSFCCEYKEGDKWHELGGHGYFRFGGFNAPSRTIGSEWHAFPRSQLPVPGSY